MRAWARARARVAAGWGLSDGVPVRYGVAAACVISVCPIVFGRWPTRWLVGWLVVRLCRDGEGDDSVAHASRCVVHMHSPSGSS